MSKSSVIWLPEVVYAQTTSPYVPSTAPPMPHIEYSRMVKADHLRRQLTKFRKAFFDMIPENARRKMKPQVMCVERWLMHYSLKHPQSTGDGDGSKRDCVFPMFANLINYHEDDDLCLLLVSDLCVAKDKEADARVVAAELIKLSHSLALDLQAEVAASASASKKGKKVDRGQVTLVSHKHTLDVIFQSAGGGTGKKRQLLKLNPVHLAKLRLAYESRTTVVDEQEFLNRVFCLLARYQTIQGHGFQAAVCEKAFVVLSQDMEVTLECFASPLNSTFGLHCSAFYDTDACFGSLGSFFDLHPTQGSFEANPPFVLAVMDAMLVHIAKLFEAATGPLSFVVVVPAWEEASFHTALSQSAQLRRKIIIAKGDHGFCDGASHQRQDRYMDSPYDTLLFVLQNETGACKWPCTDGIEKRLRSGFATGKPTEAMRLRHAREGRGTADECRGVYKGSKKNKTGEGVMKRKSEELKEKKQKRAKRKLAGLEVESSEEAEDFNIKLHKKQRKKLKRA
jgi:phosphorylated CTD-interacting factor 1